MNWDSVTQEDFDPDFFRVGEQVEYNLFSSGYDGPKGWFLGTMKEIDQYDPAVPWKVLLRPEHQHITNEVDGICWFNTADVRKVQYVIDEEPFL